MAMPRLADQALSVDDIGDALSFIRCEDRTKWVRVARALWAELGDAGESLWFAWGQREYAKWDERNARQQWKAARGTTGVHIGTLLHLALEGGWDWKSKQRQELTAEQVAQREREREERAKQAAAEERKRQGEAAKLANEVWGSAAQADDTHAYLQRKQVHAHGLRLGQWPVFNDDGSVRKWVPDALLVPIVNAVGKLRSLQAIFPAAPAGWETDKSYLRGGEKHGCFHIIGTPKAGQSVILCEGYATGASIYQATGWCVVVCFDANNLLPVAERLADLMPGHSFVFAADNDRWSRTGRIENPGVHYAAEAGRVINARVVVPEFKSLDGEPTDFNDLAVREGDAEVLRQLIPALPMAANDNAVAGSDDESPAEVDRYGLPDQGGRGAVLPTLRNLQEICARLRVTVRYNEITKAEEILIPDKAFSVDNYARATLNWLRNECVLFRMPTDAMRGNLLLMAEENHYNPVVTWVTSKPWDRRSRLRELCDTLTVADASKAWLRDVLVKRWMLSAIAAAFTPEGVAAQGILVLQGPQYLGKTRWMLSLTPESMRLAMEGMTLNPSDRDSVKQCLSFWLVELGELDATFRKSDIAALKSFLTRKSDVFRKAYAEDDSHYARRTAFFGSVNPKQFLHDPTGNRRFWTIECSGVNPDHGIDMQQVWAEVLELYQAGEQWHLTADEIAALNESNENFTAIDPVEERLQSRLLWGADPQYWTWRTATDVLISVGVDRPTQSDCTKAAGIIGKLNGDQRRRTAKGRLLLVPPVSRDMPVVRERPAED